MTTSIVDGPWIRLGVVAPEHNYLKPAEIIGEDQATVVLDEGAVRQLVGQLNDWLARPKVHEQGNA